MTSLDRVPRALQDAMSPSHDLLRALGGLVFRPWFDSLALHSLAEWYFPLSRGWAAANAAHGDLASFLAALPASSALNRRVLPALHVVEARARAYEAATLSWEEAFFGGMPLEAERAATLERSRHRAAHRHMSARLAFLPFKRHLPPVRWEVAPPEEVERRHAHRLEASGAAFPPPPDCAIDLSAAMPTSYGQDQWLRFRSPVLGDRAWARVHSPRGAADPPSFIFLHGIGMESEMWAGTASVVAPLIGRGFRTIAPEGPWHGRRRVSGYYGGEPIFARGPLGLLDMFQAWVSEVAVLIDWARGSSRGPVVLGGVSLGALTAQLAACAARQWPAPMRPDLLLLVATTGRLLDIAQHGSMTRVLGLPATISSQGWSEAQLARWLPLLQPDLETPLPPERVLMVLGTADDLTPFAGGQSLAEAWGLPTENLFLRDQGHFSVSLGLLPDPAPLDQLTARVDGLGQRIGAA